MSSCTNVWIVRTPCFTQQSVKVEMETSLNNDDRRQEPRIENRHDGDEATNNGPREPKTHFEKNLYTFSPTAGHHLKQEMTDYNKL